MSRRRSGRSVFDELRQAASRSRSRVADVGSDLEDADQRAEKLLADRAEVFEELASHYLPDLDSVDGANAFREVRREIDSIRAERDGLIRRLQADMERGRAESDALQVEIDTTTAALDAEVEKREELEEQVAARLAADPAYAALATRAAESEQVLQRDEERALEIEQDAKEKRPDYEGSRLFMYLYDRKFGTAEYKGRGFARWADRKVAALIGYETARQGYEFLCKTPELVGLEVERRTEEFDLLMDQVELGRDKVAVELGLPQVLAEGERLGAERDELVAKLSEAEAHFAALSQELADTEASHGAFYEKALVRLRAFLEGTERWVLDDRAKSTPERTDDQLVSEIRGLDRDIERARDTVGKLTERRARDESVATDLEGLVLRFRQAEFDSHRSNFGGLDLDDDLDRFLEGRMSTEELWRRIQRSQDFEPMMRHTTGRRAGFDVGSVGDLLNSSGGRVLTNVLGSVLGSALGNAGRRSMQRRSSSRSSSWPRSGPSRGSGGGGRSSGGGSRRAGSPGFTRGGGF